MQFTSLKTGLQNLQSRLQYAPAVDASALMQQEALTSKIIASIGNISSLGEFTRSTFDSKLTEATGLYDDVVKQCVHMLVSGESRILAMQKVMPQQTLMFPTDARDLLSKFQNALHAVDAAARPHNVRVMIESPSARRQKFHQEQHDAQAHVEAEAEAMRVFRASLKQSAVTAEKKGSVQADAAAMPAPLHAKSRRSTIM